MKSIEDRLCFDVFSRRKAKKGHSRQKVNLLQKGDSDKCFWSFLYLKVLSKKDQKGYVEVSSCALRNCVCNTEVCIRSHRTTDWKFRKRKKRFFDVLRTRKNVTFNESELWFDSASGDSVVGDRVVSPFFLHKTKTFPHERIREIRMTRTCFVSSSCSFVWRSPRYFEERVRTFDWMSLTYSPLGQVCRKESLPSRECSVAPQ